MIKMKKLIIILGVLGASFSAVLVRYSDAPSTVLVLYRMLWCVVMLSPMIALRHREELQHTQIKQILLCVVNGIFLGMHFTCYFESLRYTSIASSVVLVDTEVFFVGLVALTASLCGGYEVVHIGMKNLLVAFGLALMCTLLGHSIFSWGLKYEKASFVSTAKLLEPIFASVLGILLFREIPSVTSVAGGAVVITGIILCVRSGNDKKKRAK